MNHETLLRRGVRACMAGAVSLALLAAGSPASAAPVESTTLPKLTRQTTAAPSSSLPKVTRTLTPKTARVGTQKAAPQETSGATAGVTAVQFGCEEGAPVLYAMFANGSTEDQEVPIGFSAWSDLPTMDPLGPVPVPANSEHTYVAWSGFDDGEAFRFWDLADPVYPYVLALSAPTCASDDTVVNPFTDSNYDDQFGMHIDFMYQQGISTGWLMPDGTREFRPLTSMNRDAMAAFLYRLAGKPDFTPTKQSFTDVTPATDFYKEIEWLASEGISTGWSMADGTYQFRPFEPVNRDAMAAFLYRFGLYEGMAPYEETAGEQWFIDVPGDIEHHLAMNWMAASEISTGWPLGEGMNEYRPTQPVNRDAMAAFVYRFTDFMTYPGAPAR